MLRVRQGGAGKLQKLVFRGGSMAEYSEFPLFHARNCRFGPGSLAMKLDRYDRAIVRALQLDGRITNSQLAESVSLSESATLRRVRALEESGFIEGYTARINQQKAGCPVNVFVNITLERQEQAHLHAFEEAARKVPEVMECYLMSGEYDYLLRVVLADTADFERLHSQHLTRLPNVARVQSSFALRTVQKSRELPVR
jgi:Lrp/AsnC family transcriptional regulator, leucine-responsive regulatory protein